MTKIDPHGHKKRYESWLRRVDGNGIEGVSPQNSELILRYVKDMEVGRNVSVVSKKGPRSYIRLNTIRFKMIYFAREFEQRFGTSSLTDTTEDHLLSFFGDMRKGLIRKKDGEVFQTPGFYVKVFKAFWHWHMTVKRREGIDIADITTYLDTRNEKPKWVYLTYDDIQKLCDHALLKYRVLMLFLLDSAIRSPTELVNVRVSDLSEDFTRLHIRPEISKTFGRRINLLLSATLLRRYIADSGKQPSDCLFPVSPTLVNRYLRNLARRCLGTGMSPGGEHYDKLTMYDFRHSSACYWLPRYKHESSLKYRFGWKKTEQIHYYTEFLGMKDTIQQEDLNLVEEKTELEQRLAQSERDKVLMQDKMDAMQQQLASVADKVSSLLSKLPDST